MRTGQCGTPVVSSGYFGIDHLIPGQCKPAKEGVYLLFVHAFSYFGWLYRCFEREEARSENPSIRLSIDVIVSSVEYRSAGQIIDFKSVENRSISRKQKIIVHTESLCSSGQISSRFRSVPCIRISGNTGIACRYERPS